MLRTWIVLIVACACGKQTSAPPSSAPSTKAEGSSAPSTPGAPECEGACLGDCARDKVAACVAACDRGDSVRCAGAAYELDMQVSTADDRVSARREAMRVMAKACAAHYARLCAELADVYWSGKDIPRDPDKAYELFAIACVGNVAGACESVANRYPEGDKRRGELLAKGCELDADSCAHYADELEALPGGKAPSRKLVEVLERGCSGKLPGQACLRAAAWRNGEHVAASDGDPSSVDRAKASNLLTRAIAELTRECDLELLDSCVTLAGEYERGNHVPANRGKALELYRTTCKHGDEERSQAADDACERQHALEAVR